MRATARLGLALAVLAASWGPEAASAQMQVGGMTLEGWMEAGFRLLPGEPSNARRGKFEEYRDITEGPILGGLSLRLARPDERYAVELDGANWGQQDQQFALRAGRLGLWEFGWEWDQTRHIFSTTGRTLATETGPGVWALPAPRPPLATHNLGRELDEISTRWDTARISLRLTPTPDWNVHLEYTRIDKNGDAPTGMAFGSPGSNLYEVLRPIDETVQDFRLRAAWSGEQWQLQFGYAFSVFQNAHKAVVADNPCFGLAACGAALAGGPPRVLMSLAPDNMAHTFTLAGGVNLPLRTRLTANVSYGLRLQDESFLAHTINPALVSPGLALPDRSLDGVVGVLLVNLGVTSRPLRPLTLSLRYRVFDYNDMSNEPVFPAHVVNDATLVAEERRAGRYEYTRHNLDLDARIRIAAPLSVTLGGGWERWDRNEHREVPTSDEVFGKLAVDLTPLDWLTARLTYRPSFRRISAYNTFAHLEHTVVEEVTPTDRAQGQSPLLRKFDEGERDRQRVDLLLQLTPLESLTASLTAGWRADDYINSALGLRDEHVWSAGVDVSWAPAERLSVYAGYTHESIFQRQRSRSRPVTGTTTFDFADFEWVSNSTDTIDTVYGGLKVSLIPKVLEWTAGATFAYALGRLETRNPVAPTSGTAAQNFTAQAKPTPAFEDSLLRVDTALRYSFWKVWTATLGYAFESFEKQDWRTDRLNPFVPGQTSIWLGNDFRDYTAHIVAVTLGYRFK